MVDYNNWANTGSNLPAGFDDDKTRGGGSWKAKHWNAGTATMMQGGFDDKLEAERRKSANKYDQWT